MTEMPTPTHPIVPEDIPPLRIFGAVAAILKHLRVVLGIPVALVAVVAGILLALPRQYTVNLDFVPASTSSTLSQLAGLAAQFGLTGGGGGGGDASDSPDFYSDFIKSDQLLQAVAGADYGLNIDGGPRRGDLALAFDVDSGPRAVMIEKAGMKLLLHHLSVDVAAKTGVVTLSVTTEDPDLSMQIINQVMREVNRFNREVRQSQAGQERAFLGVRADSALRALRASEDRMQAFLQRNRAYQSSPQLQFESDRLQRDITMRQTLYTGLLQSYEQAREEEVRSTPVVTVIEPPVRPAMPDSRRLVLRALLLGIVGLMMGVGVALALEAIERKRLEEPAEVEEVRRLWRARWAEVTTLARRLRRRT